MDFDERFSEEERKWLEKWDINISYDAFKEAMTHPNYKNLYPDERDFERYEFLGDAALDLIIADLLFSDEEDLSEGDMTSKRSRLVNNDVLALIFDKIGLKEFIRIEENYQPSTKKKADFVESILGAIFYTNGYKVTKSFWKKIWDSVEQSIKEMLKLREEEWFKTSKELTLEEIKIRENLQKRYVSLGLRRTNPISALQELCQATKMPLPIYRVINTEGPDDNKLYTVEVKLNPFNDEPEMFYMGIGKGKSIKKAERIAAMLVCKKLYLPYI